MILSTCNRVEVAVTAEESSDAANSVDEFLAEARSVEPNWVSPYLYHYNDPTRSVTCSAWPQAFWIQ